MLQITISLIYQGNDLARILVLTQPKKVENSFLIKKMFLALDLLGELKVESINQGNKKKRGRRQNSNKESNQKGWELFTDCFFNCT